MNRHFLSPAILACALLAASPAPPAAAQGGGLSCLGGGSLSDSDLARGTTVVVVWASWSPRSRDIVDRVNALASRWGGQARVVTVNFQEDRGAIEGKLGKGFNVPVCLDADGAFCRKHGIATLPGLLVVRDGKAVYHGKLPEDPDKVLADLLR